jgi:hypothetical protein
MYRTVRILHLIFTKLNLLMLYKTKVTVCSEMHAKHTNTI